MSIGPTAKAVLSYLRSGIQVSRPVNELRWHVHITPVWKVTQAPVMQLLSGNLVYVRNEAGIDYLELAGRKEEV